MQNINFILGSDSVTVYVDSNSYTINRQAHTFPMVMKALADKNIDALRDAVNIRKSIVESLQRLSANVTIKGTQIFYGDREVTGLIVGRIFEVIENGLDVQPMVKFIENLMNNPSKRAVDELFGFLDACDLPITSDGHFLAYKRVRGDYKDVYSGSMDNSVGQVVEVPRNMVDEDKNNTCSYGLHFCSYSYLKHFGGERIVVVKINPADVVAIPADYNNSKGRTCRYEVVDEIPLNEYKLPETELQSGYCNQWDIVEFDDDTDDDYVMQDDDEPSTCLKVPASAKLTEQEVRDIRESLGDGWGLTDVSRMFNISPRQVARIRDGLAWKNVV